MPMNVESSNPLKFFQGGLFKDDKECKKKKKIIYFSPLSFVLLSSVSIISIFLCFSFAHFAPFIHLAHCPVILVLFLIISAITSHR